MLTKVWKSCYASVCRLSFVNERGIVIDALTGFKVDKSLVTSEQAFYIPKAKKVEICFVDEDANTVTASMRVDYAEFVNDLRIGFSNNHSDYAVFNLDFAEFKDIPSLSLCERRHLPIGEQVAMLSYSCGGKNLSIKNALISSAFANADGVRYIQIDGLTSCGNSGSPVIDPATMAVIAIVARRTTPAAKAYQQLQEIIASNLEVLKGIEGSIKLGDIDPVQVLVANQNQLKLLVNNIYRYAPMGASQAVMLDQIISYFNEKSIENKYNQIVIEKVGVKFM
ncbi:MAG: trypsin-like peptidase domain-containing protein [Bacteroidales bacterium]|nr:trypsin-like peptidase domain-containing protein [Bacteroidales bacterium]